MNKRRIVPLVILLLLITPFLVLINIPTTQAATTWWDLDWHYRAPINITGSTIGALTNYPVQFDLFAGSGACSGNDIYTNGTAQADYDDIRFIANDQITLYEYWLVDNYTWVYPDATVWVNVTSIPENPDVVTIWAYWDNDEASSLSDGSAVFPFFDDLLTDPDTNADWIIQEGTPDFVTHHDWYVRVIGTAGSDGWSYIKGNVDLILSGASSTYGWAMEWDQAIDSSGVADTFPYWGAGLANDLSHEALAFDKLYNGVSWYWKPWDPWANRFFYYCEWNAAGNIQQSNSSLTGWTYGAPGVPPVGGWTRYKMTLFTDSSYVTQNGTELVDFDSLSANYLGVGQNPSYSGHGKAGDSSATHGYVNWVFMRPIADPEPTIGVGSSESAVIAFGIHNMDGCGNWVHEGRKQYIFYINISLPGDIGSDMSAGMGFYDDAGDWYSFYYNNETGRMTLVSPDDGISASLRDVETGDHWLYVNFTVLFNPTVADTLDVDLYARYNITSVGDSGWYVYSADYFNIYNLGGFATLTASGYAGRTAGGDVFEIYAADENVPILMPTQNFDVRKNALEAGWKILGSWVLWPASEEILIDELQDWDVFITEREINHTILLTNRLPEGRPADSKAFVSYPFGMRIIDSPPSAASEAFSEYPFIRPITAASGELVTVQWMWMTPLTSGTMGMCSVTDNGFYPYFAQGIVGVNTAARVRFAGNGTLQAYDGPVWVSLQTYTGYTWYNMTMVLNVTAQTYDVYVDDVLRGDDLDFPVTCNTLGNIGFYRDVAAGNYTDVFIDDVEANTDWDADYGGDVTATALFRLLQHWSMDWDFKVEEGREYIKAEYANYGFIELGWDVCLNGIWEYNFLVARINITDGKVRDNHNYVEFNITWTQNGTYVRHDILYGLFGTFKVEAGLATKDAIGWHWDIWFNSMNASTVVGGRLNTEYFGMTNKATWTWGSNWKPVHSDFTESECFVDLVDSDGVIHSAKEVSLVRPWVRVYRDNRSTFHYAIANIETEFPTTSETMSGIDTPEIQDTIVPQGPPPSGFAAFLSSAIKRIMEDMLSGILMAATNLGIITVGIVNFMGGLIGFPKIMSNMLSWIGNSWGYFVTVLNELFLFQLIGLVFGIVTSIFGHFVWWATSMIKIFTDIFTLVWAIWDGTYTGVGFLQDMWALMNWPVLVEAMPIFLAIAWFDSLDKRWRANGRQGYFGILFGDIEILTKITSFVVFLAGRIYEWTVSTITRIMLVLKR